MDAAAPLLCAGITVYSPMKYYGLDKPGMRLGVVGLGGLGHMAVKFGKVMDSALPAAFEEKSSSMQSLLEITLCEIRLPAVLLQHAVNSLQSLVISHQSPIMSNLSSLSMQPASKSMCVLHPDGAVDMRYCLWHTSTPLLLHVQLDHGRTILE